MKLSFYSLLFLLTALALGSCKYDNYNPPKLQLDGQLMYNGKPFQFDGKPDGDVSNIIQLSQYGFGKSGNPITASVNADGSFKQLLFPGAYHITVKNTPYPFVFTEWPKNAANQYDTMHVNINSAYKMRVNVEPYYEVANVSGKVVGTDLVVTFKINKVRDGASLVKARVYANTAEIVNSGVRMSTEKSLSGVDITQPVEIKVSLIDYRAKFTNNFRNYMFFRVALETNISTTYFLWSDVFKAENLPLKFNDVTAQYLKNYQQPFTLGATLPNDPGRRAIVTDWLYTPPMEETMYDGWSDRRAMSAENWGWRQPSLTGAIWQAPTLPAGKYVLSVTRIRPEDMNGPNAASGSVPKPIAPVNRAFVGIATGATLTWNSTNIIQKADLGDPANLYAVTIPFEVQATSQVSIGYAVNFPGNELNAIFFTSWKLIKVD